MRLSVAGVSQTCAVLLVRQLYNVGVCRCLSLLSPAYSRYGVGAARLFGSDHYSAETSLGMLVALRCASWGRWSRRCCLPGGRVGVDGGNRPDAGDGVALSMEMMAVDPLRCDFRRALGGA